MKLLGKIILLTLSFSAWNNHALANPQEAHGKPEAHEAQIEEVEEERPKNAFELHEEEVVNAKSKPEQSKSIIFKGYAPFRASFSQICALIDQDGQLGWINLKSAEYANNKQLCIPCRALYLSFETACKPKKVLVPKVKKKKKKKEEEEAEEDAEPEATPTPPKKVIRLDPGTELLDKISILFRDMAERKPVEAAAGYFQGIEHFLIEMRKPDGKSIAEKAYYDTLAEFIEAPFKARGLTTEDKKSLKSGKNVPIPTPSSSLDDLF